jgi:hypothetical protein
MCYTVERFIRLFAVGCVRMDINLFLLAVLCGVGALIGALVIGVAVTMVMRMVSASNEDAE